MSEQKKTLFKKKADKQATAFSEKKAIVKLKKKRRTMIIASAGAALLVVIIVAIALSKGGSDSTSTTTYKVTEVSSGDVTESVSGSGTITAKDSATITASYDGTVTQVNKTVGDTVSAGDLIAVVDSPSLDSAISRAADSLARASTNLSNATKYSSSKEISAPVAGRIKSVKVSAGSDVETIMSESGYLCLISTDGKMKLVIETDKTVAIGDTVTVTIDTAEVAGTITKIEGKTVTIIISKNTYTVGAAATVKNAAGEALGEGALELNAYVAIKATDGTISSVYKKENSTVSSDTTLFSLKSYPITTNYKSLTLAKQSALNNYNSLLAQKYVSVDFDGTITVMSLRVGDSVTAGETLAAVSGKTGYTMSISVDELDIDSVKLNQDATITLEALSGTYNGYVSDITYTSVTNNTISNYTVTVTIDDIDGALSGMSASASIAITSSGETLMVPVSAVQTENGASFLYLASSSMQAGDEYAESEVNLSSLEKVTVKTGVSDGSYIQITGEIAEGDLIVVPTVTTNSSSSDDEEEQGGFNMGGMTGGFSGNSGSFTPGERPSGSGTSGRQSNQSN